METATTPSRRTFLGAASGALLAGGAACAPGATPAAPGSGAPAAAKAAWEQEWDALVAAAKRESRLNLITGVGANHRQALDAFEKAFPGITVETQSFASASLVIPKLQQERGAGVFGWDAAQFSVQSFLTTLKPAGVFDPIREAITRPDVKDDRAWTEGFEAGFADNEKKWVYVFNWTASRWWVNTDLVREGEIKNVTDLLAPKWRGKIGIVDVRSGTTYTIMLAIKQNLGDETVRQLIVGQQPVFNRDERLLTEALVRGQVAVCNSRAHVFIKEFQEKGLARNIKPADLPESRSLLSSGGLWLFNRAPHHNAAKLFINWLLTKEGQDAWNVTGIGNSRRTDVPVADPDAATVPGGKYLLVVREDMLQPQEDMRKALEDLLK